MTDRPIRAPSAFRTAVAVAAGALLVLAPASGPTPAAESVAVALLDDLDFGDIAAGTTGQVAYGDAGAASFEVTCSGMLGFQKIVLSFSLPTHILNGGDSVPISFDANDAAWSYTNDIATAASFDPNASIDVAKNGNAFSIYVWIGGTIDPDAAVPPNLYTDTLTLLAEIQ